ncbi:MAG: arsenosugar biosynthesis radical SAM (seleno)protein ArsS [Planctomycetota bacterium]
MSTLSLPVVEEQAFARRFETDLRSAPAITTLQINIGLRCNLACNHCHVESSPARISETDNMSADTADRVMRWLSDNPTIETVDITGGSPEMNPNFTRIVKHARGLGMDVIDRCNPTILTYRESKRFADTVPGGDYRWVPGFLAEQRVIVTASLPCYTADNVDAQRGRGSYDASVEGLLLLNDVGYGSDPELPLNLVYNPGGASLPPPQESLEDDYKRELRERFGIEFTQLWTITNMPIKRWRRDLERAGKLEKYMDLLVNAYNPDTVEGLMCRHQIHIDSQGRLADCDFNRALDMDTPGSQGKFLWDVSAEDLAGRVIATGDHCYGCTAGSGSSCTGSLA